MQTLIKAVWYDEQSHAFEGRIDIRRGGQAFRYPCRVEGPKDMPRHKVRAAMKTQAMAMSDSPEKGAAAP